MMTTAARKFDKEQADRIEKKLDLIIDALGLSDKRRLTPNERQDVANKIVLQFREKQRNA